MARLNESTTSTESIEILKRRFVRQNREIARVNSIQSLRIRSLESEVSHLLSENVSLRERVITLSQEIERFEAAKLLRDGVYDIKARLDDKLAELGGLVADLGALPRKFNKPAGGITESVPHERPSLDSRHDIAEIEAYTTLEQDGRLPVIQEDKYYPRKTLEPHEIQKLMNNNMNTPQFSSQEEPLVSRKDSVGDDSHLGLPEVADTQECGGSLGPNEAPLPPTLETRKKRKAKPGKLHENIYDMNLPDFPARRESSSLLNTASKRKFSGSDDDGFSLTPLDEDDFQFTRPAQLSQLTSDQLLPARCDQPPGKRQISQRRSSKSDGRPKRKALEPKNTNLPLIEPQDIGARGQDCKAPERINNATDENGPMNAARLKKDVHSEKITPNERFQCDDFDKAKQEEDEDEYCQNQSHVAEDTPRPSSPQIQSELETSIPLPNALSRPTRRQRSVVSYAEPNLRDKMRRPTDEFIAAVGSDHHPRRISGSGSVRMNDEFNEHKSGKINVRKKRDPDMESTIPTPFLDNHPRQPTNMMSRKQRKLSFASKENAPTGNGHTNETSEAHACQIVESRELDGVPSGQHVAEVQTGSTGKYGSPNAVGSTYMSVEVSKSISRAAAAVPSRLSRRHSSNPRSSERGHYSPEGEMGVSGSEQDCMTRSRACAGGSNDAPIGNISEPRTFMHVSEAPRPAIGLTMEDRQPRRVPRAAARRRSMML
ncbi:hypothetical protein BDV26DRAFT_280331 [Aspergillus bertholletiae]|uniref:Shugoshin n=1 Tax=Aspergillus bertholletiae TaxID=1226010 RepID=A0A5N7BCH9_9EURO|nr:hypothetical protein BDV26DRAFT_280331 [Aspergillus bertholletiae]